MSFFNGDKKFEFRLFFPIIVEEDAAGAAASAALEQYQSAVSQIEQEFQALDGTAKEDREEIRMVYLVGCDQWGAKYRGNKAEGENQLELKYRKQRRNLGRALDVLEDFKKKDYGLTSIAKKGEKVLEKLSKHCDGEYSAALHEQSARVIEQNRLCSIMKRRAHVKRDGVQIEFAFIDIESLSSPSNHAYSAPAGNPYAAHTKWASVAVEGRPDKIEAVLASSFAAPLAAIRTALEADIAVLVGGYPAFVRALGEEPHVLVMQHPLATGAGEEVEVEDEEEGGAEVVEGQTWREVFGEGKEEQGEQGRENKSESESESKRRSEVLQFQRGQLQGLVAWLGDHANAAQRSLT